MRTLGNRELRANRLPEWGREPVPGLLARTDDHEYQGPDDFSRFHVREGAIAGLYLTETAHPAGYRIPKHSHQMASFYLLLAGSLSEQFGREDVERRTDELVFTPPDRPHANRFLGSGGRCLIIELHPAIHARLSECRGLPTDLHSFRGQSAWLAGRLYKEFRSGDAVSPLVIEGLILEILGEICRERCRRDFRLPRKIGQIREFLDSSLSQPVSLGELAKSVSLHPVYLARIFRQTYGCSVGEYFRRRRIEFVCAQLATPDKPLAQIASEAGFCDQAHLTRTFRRITGLTPGQYRQVHRA
jgi:AraC family transcriptional regulator